MPTGGRGVPLSVGVPRRDPFLSPAGAGLLTGVPPGLLPLLGALSGSHIGVAQQWGVLTRPRFPGEALAAGTSLSWQSSSSGGLKGTSWGSTVSPEGTGAGTCGLVGG